LVPIKPVLQSTTKIAGAARAAIFSKSRFICGPDCLNVRYPAIVNPAGPLAGNADRRDREYAAWQAAAEKKNGAVTSTYSGGRCIQVMSGTIDLA
jgi:hypothetical protein